MSLDQQIAAYERHFDRGGSALVEATSHISWHGYEAADRMVPYVRGTKTGIPLYEALTITWHVQLRGCDLKGTSSERVLEDVLRMPALRRDERQIAEAALVAVREHRKMNPGQLDTLRGGPCEDVRR